jgi:outer membrane protein assembly factor BamB
VRWPTTICCSAVALITALTTPIHAQNTTAPRRAVKQTHSSDDKTPLSLFPLMPAWSLALNNAITAPVGFRDKYAVFALENEQLAAYDLESGARLWLKNVDTTIQPAIGASAVFVSTDDALMALSIEDGSTIWTRESNDELAVAPVVAGDDLIVATADGDIVAHRASDGAEIWRRRLPRSASSPPAPAANRLFVPLADSSVVALDLQNGEVAWTTRLGGIGHDILPDGDRVFLGAQDRYFYCLNAKNGEVDWRWPTGADAIGLPVVDERTVYFVSLDNVLRALNRSSGVQRWKSPLAVRPIAGPLRYLETLVVAGTTPLLQAYSTRDGKVQGRYSVPTELSAPPYLFADRRHVFPVLVTISADIVGRATVSGTTRDVEPTPLALSPLPNAESVPAVPELPEPLSEINALPNLIPVVPADAR